MIRQYPIKQEFKNYTEEDFFVWKTLFSRQTSLLKDKVYSKFFDYLNMLNINENEIPNIYLLSKIIEEKTGWQLQIVPSIVPIKQFLCMLEQKIFPTTCWLRQKHEIDYIEEPDMFHDVFGHVPFL
jgi:phenylalanine-4-hydroxylase